MRAALIATLLAGCMTDPNGDSCVWSPGNDGFCPSDSSSSSSAPKYIVTDYVGPSGAPFAGYVRVAMTRTRTEEPHQIETALVRPGEQPVHAPILLDGEPLTDAYAPQLAAFEQHTYLVWKDRDQHRQHGALVASNGSLVGPVSDLGDGTLYVVGERFAVVHPATTTATLRATWIDRDGRRGDTTELADGLYAPKLLDASGGDRFLALATVGPDGGLAITRIAGSGTVIDRVAIALPGKTAAGQLVPTLDGGMLGQFTVVADDGPTEHLVIVDADGTVAVMAATLPPLSDLVRVPLGIVATTYDPQSSVRVLDDTGLEIVAPFSLANRAFADVVPTPDGFALVHKGPNAAVAVTPMPGGVPTPSIDVAHRTSEEVGCGCRTATPGTSALFALALLGVLRRRRMLPRCKSPSSAPG